MTLRTDVEDVSRAARLYKTNRLASEALGITARACSVRAGADLQVKAPRWRPPVNASTVEAVAEVETHSVFLW